MWTSVESNLRSTCCALWTSLNSRLERWRWAWTRKSSLSENLCNPLWCNASLHCHRAFCGWRLGVWDLLGTTTSWPKKGYGRVKHLGMTLFYSCYGRRLWCEPRCALSVWRNYIHSKVLSSSPFSLTHSAFWTKSTTLNIMRQIVFSIILPLFNRSQRRHPHKRLALWLVVAHLSFPW